MPDNSEVNIKYNIDEKLKNKEEIFFKYYDMPYHSEKSIPEFSDKEKIKVTFNEINRISPPTPVTNVKCCLIFWDDIVQYTTLGAMDLFKELVYDGYNSDKNIKNPEEFEYYPIEFFYRKNSLIDGSIFMYYALNEIYSLDQIRRFIKKFYIQILTKSPFSGILPTIGDSIQMIEKVVFVFKHKLDETIKESLIKDIYQYWDTTPVKKNIVIVSQDEYSNEQIYENYKPDAIFTPDGGETLTYLVENKISNVDIFTNLIHNGFSFYFLDQYVMKLKMSFGPGLNKIHFYEDQIHVNDPDAFKEIAEIYEKELEKKGKNK